MENELESVHHEEAPDQTTLPKSKSSALRFFIDILETLVLSVILFVVINTISARIRVDGFSMEPTLHSGEFVVVNKLTYKFNPPQMGDVIVFHFPRDPEQEYIKRVIGLPGDQVIISDKQVMVNGQILDEPYIAVPPVYDSRWTVTEGSLFVLGDNRNNSSDSHNWGFVPLEELVGKAVFIYWPPSEWGLVEHIAPPLTLP